MHVHSQGDQQRKRKLRCSTKREGTFRLLFPQAGGGQRRLSSRAVPGAKGMPRVTRGARTNFGAGAGAGAKLGSWRTLPALGRAAAARTPRSSGMPQPRRGREPPGQHRRPRGDPPGAAPHLPGERSLLALLSARDLLSLVEDEEETYGAHSPPLPDGTHVFCEARSPSPFSFVCQRCAENNSTRGAVCQKHSDVSLSE